MNGILHLAKDFHARSEAAPFIERRSKPGQRMGAPSKIPFRHPPRHIILETTRLFWGLPVLTRFEPGSAGNRHVSRSINCVCNKIFGRFRATLVAAPVEG